MLNHGISRVVALLVLCGSCATQTRAEHLTNVHRFAQRDIAGSARYHATDRQPLQTGAEPGPDLFGDHSARDADGGIAQQNRGGGAPQPRCEMRWRWAPALQVFFEAGFTGHVGITWRYDANGDGVWDTLPTMPTRSQVGQIDYGAPVPRCERSIRKSNRLHFTNRILSEDIDLHFIAWVPPNGQWMRVHPCICRYFVRHWTDNVNGDRRRYGEACTYGANVDLCGPTCSNSNSGIHKTINNIVSSCSREYPLDNVTVEMPWFGNDFWSRGWSRDRFGFYAAD
jgi:hypothetical protein